MSSALGIDPDRSVQAVLTMLTPPPSVSSAQETTRTPEAWFAQWSVPLPAPALRKGWEFTLAAAPNQ